MKSTIVFTALLLVASAFASADDAAVRKALNANYAKMSAGYKKGDVNAVIALMLPTTARSEASFVRNNISMMKVADVKYKITAMKVTGAEAMAFVTATFLGSMKDPGGKMHSASVKQGSIDTWISTPKGWMLKRSATNGTGGGMR